jgi:DNA-directed RNA polymerase specialized sigma24 family protein
MGETSRLRGKAEILTEIYISADVENMIRSLKPIHLQDDIKQHCFMELFEKSEEFIMELYNKGKLKNYIIKVLYNTSRWSFTNLSKQLGKETPTEFFEDQPDDEYSEIDIEPILKKVYWYKCDLIRLYAEHGTYQKVSDLTGIPLKSVYTTIIEARKEIKTKYYESI